MSLQVWLPLNGDLKNQGLANVITNGIGSDNSWDTTSSKIGKSSLLLTKITNTISVPSLIGKKEMSFAYWVRVNNAWSTNWLDGIRWYSTNGSTDTYSRQEFYTNCTKVGVWFAGSPNSNSGKDFSVGIWHHLAFSISYLNGTSDFYIDGALVGHTTGVYTDHYIQTGNFQIGDSGVDININDFRIYDHYLSAKEVKEIAKGLILHYKLDDRYIESIVPLDCIISNTAYNAANKKYGYNNDSNLIKTEEYLFGKKCTKIATRTSDVSAQPYVYFSNLFTSDGTNQPAYKALSFDYYTTVSSTTFLNIYKLGSGEGTVNWKTINSDGVFTGTYTNSSNSIRIKPNEWNHVEVILHGTTAANAEWGYCINGTSYTSSPNKFFLFANIQLEENDHITGYGVNMHSTKVYDSSGYNYNSDLTGSINMVSDTPKYNISTQFPGTVYCKRTSPCAEIRTVSLWANWNSIPSGQSIIYVDSKSRTGLGLMSTGILCSANGITSFTFSKSNLVANTWYHFAIVCPNGPTGAARKLYINGVEQTATSKSDVWSYSVNELQVGKRSTSSDGFNGKLSDFRMYATALSAEDILELYNTSASIDKNGNIYAREVIEQ